MTGDRRMDPVQITFLEDAPNLDRPREVIVLALEPDPICGCSCTMRLAWDDDDTYWLCDACGEMRRASAAVKADVEAAWLAEMAAEDDARALERWNREMGGER